MRENCGPKRGKQRSRRNVQQARMVDLDRRRIGRDRWRAARRPQISQRHPPSRGNAAQELATLQVLIENCVAGFGVSATLEEQKPQH